MGGKLTREANYFEGLFVSGVVLFRGAFVLGGFLTGGYGFRAFVRGFLRGSFDRITKKRYSKWNLFPDIRNALQCKVIK